MENSDKKKIVLGIKILITIIFSLLFSMVVIKLLNRNVNMDFKQMFFDLLKGNSIVSNKILIFFCIFMFIGMNFIFDIKKMYSFIFNKRWWVALILLFVLVANKYNGDSISIYDSVVQPGVGSEYVYPIIGESRPIRSDEWVVDTPSQLSSHYGDNPYSQYNSIMRGEKTLNSVTGVYLDYSTIGKSLFEFGFPILGIERGMSFSWFAPIILLFMVSIEMFLIISKRNKLLSVSGAFLVVFSSFYLWWNFPSILLSLQSAIVCLYYFFNTENKVGKVLLSIGTALAGANFVTVLYPAWQVPMGFVGLVLIAWLIKENYEKIKETKKFGWIVLSIAFIFMCSVIVLYLVKNKEYVQAISSTVYPGARKDLGGYGIHKMFYYIQALFYSYVDIENASESSVFLSFFPIPLIVASYLWIKSKKKDILTGGLLLISYGFLVYIIIGLPELVAKITLMTYTVPYRLIDIVGFIQVYLIIIIFSRFEEVKKLPKSVGAIGAIVTITGAIMISRHYFPQYLTVVQLLVPGVIIALLGVIIISGYSKKAINIFCFGVILISIFTGMRVRPIVKGLDAIYSKPVAKAIEEISQDDSDGKWIAYGGGSVLPSYAIACGAPTINSVNIYPNMELWQELDPSGKYNDVYNRYARINLELTKEDTSFSLIAQDYMELKLSYKDIKKTEVKYILSIVPLSDNEFINLTCLYQEYGSYIYRID